MNEMTTIRTIQGVLGLAVLGCALGCGSSSNAGSGDFGALYTQYTKPSATLGKGDLPSVVKALSTNSAQKSIPVTGASLAPGGLRVQDITETLSCTDGGNFSIGIPTESSNYETATITYSDCSYDPGESVSGTLNYAFWSSPTSVWIYDGTLTVTSAGQTDQITLDYALLDGEITWSVSVDGGNVLVSESGSWDPTTNSGDFTITDSRGSWSCTWNGSSGKCTGSGGTVSYP
jgi:hypothetical protein